MGLVDKVKKVLGADKQDGKVKFSASQLAPGNADWALPTGSPAMDGGKNVERVKEERDRADKPEEKK